MRFVLVNNRAPHPQSTCKQCGTPLVAGYIRDLSSRLLYCDHRCYPGPTVATSSLSCMWAGIAEDRRNKIDSVSPDVSEKQSGAVFMSGPGAACETKQHVFDPGRHS